MVGRKWVTGPGGLHPAVLHLIATFLCDFAAVFDKAEAAES